MLPMALSLFLSSPLLMLRLSDTVGSFPKPLSDSEEQMYLERLAHGDQEARSKLIEHNLRLVAHIIKKYYTQAEDQDDLISIGTIGLIKGITSYDAKRKVRLATYASRCIENEILMHFRHTKKTAGDISLSESIDSDNEGNSLQLMDIISVPDTMLEDIGAEETRQQLVSYLEKALDKREREIIFLRYGLWNMKMHTQRETAEKLGISRSYVSRIEKRAVEKLRSEFERNEAV